MNPTLERISRIWGNQYPVGLTVAALAVAIRLIYLAGTADDPSFLLPLVDSGTYHDLAADLAANGVFTDRFLWQAVFYPYFLAGIYTVFGVSIPAAVIAQILLGGATCYLTHRLALHLFGSVPAVVAGLICAFSGPLIFFETRLLATGWTAFLTVSLALVLAIAESRPSRRICLEVGLISAVAILTRPTFVPLVGMILIWMIWAMRRQQKPWSEVAIRVGVVMVGLVLVLGPVSLMLKARTGHPGIIPPSGGINLFIGNNADYDQTINTRPGLPWEELMAEPGRHGYAPDPWSGQPYFFQKVTAFARENPGRFLALQAEKALQLISSREMPRNLDIYLHRQWSGVLGALVFKLGRWGFPWGLVFPLALVGLTTSFRKIPASFLILLVMYGASLVVVFISARYRAPLIPLLAVLAGQGMVSVWRTARMGNRPALIRQGILLLAGILAVTLPGPFAQEQVDLEPELYFGVGFNFYQRDNWSEAVWNLQRSVDLDRGVAEPRNFLGISLARIGRLEEACAQFDTAVTLKPGYGEAKRNLGRCRRLVADRQIEKALLLATSRVDSLRDGREAVRLLQPLNDKMRAGDPRFRLAMAAALAENGDFEGAVAEAEEGLRVALKLGDLDLEARIRMALSDFRARKPLRIN